MHRLNFSAVVASFLVGLAACGPDSAAPLQRAVNELLCNGACVNFQTKPPSPA